jgi:uncharacterized protein
MMIHRALQALLLGLVSFTLLPALSGAAAIPVISRPVNDYAGVITPAQENKIADLLIAHRKKTGVQVAVLTVGTTGKMSIEEFSLKTAEKWGGGSKERDDGLLFTVAVNDRRMRIEVGYGLEGYITDLRAGRILDGIRADFKKYAYGQGIEKAVKEIILHTDELRAGEALPVMGRIRGAFFHLFKKYHVSYFILGALIAGLFMVVKKRLKFSVWITIALYLFIYAGIPVVLQLYLPGIWYWGPVVFLTGALVGASIIAGTLVYRSKTGATVSAIILGLISLGVIIYCLHILKPLQETGTRHESVLLIVLFYTNIFQLVMLIAYSIAGSETGGSYSNNGYSQDSYSGSSSSYDSSSSSGSSNDTSWSGGGGSYGGGGASSSW